MSKIAFNLEAQYILFRFEILYYLPAYTVLTLSEAGFLGTIVYVLTYFVVIFKPKYRVFYYLIELTTEQD